MLWDFQKNNMPKEYKWIGLVGIVFGFFLMVFEPEIITQICGAVMLIIGTLSVCL